MKLLSNYIQNYSTVSVKLYNTRGLTFIAVIVLFVMMISDYSYAQHGSSHHGEQTGTAHGGQQSKSHNHSSSHSHIDAAHGHHNGKEAIELETITVTAEKISEYAAKNPQAVVVLEQKEIQERNILGVEEALGSMSGVDVKRSTGGIGSRISIRGSGKSSGVLVLLNGRPLNTSQYGSVDLSTISIDTVKSITVFKPPVPVWLGSGASEGAVTITTHDFKISNESKERAKTRLKFNAGSYGAAEASASRQMQTAGGDNIMITASGSRRDGKRDNNDKNSGTASFHWDRDIEAETNAGVEMSGSNASDKAMSWFHGDLVEPTKIEADARFYTAEYGAAGPVDNPTPDARQKYQKGSIDVRILGIIGGGETGYEAETIDDSKISEKINNAPTAENDEIFIDSGLVGDFSLNIYTDMVALEDKSQSGFKSEQDYLKIGLKPETIWLSESDEWGLRVGAIAEQENIDETLSGEHDRFSVGLSSQYDRKWDIVTGTAGLRCDYASDFDFNPGASAGVGWSITEKLIARINSGYSVNIPSFSQLYQPSHGSIDQVRGNPDLDEEKVFSYDMGVEYRVTGNSNIQFSLFRSDTDDLISYQRGNDLIYRPINIDSGCRQGMELIMKQSWKNGIIVDVSCIWQNSENQDSGKELPYTPKGKVKTTLKYTVPKWLTRLETTLRYESEQFSEAENKASEKLDDYTTMDVKMTQPLAQSLFFKSVRKIESEWYLEVINLCDTGFEIHHGYPDDGVRFSTGINIAF